ncbi:endonuclease MutS2 [Gilvibacter sediminis]|uniref:endonuclease MutS2 n=1 Tax=Gilvibacter sediminis TaxID=379071 RepID=UPI003AF31C20
MVSIPKKTLEDLEFPQMLEHIAEGCITASGKEAVGALQPFKSKAPALVALEQTREFLASLHGDNRIPNHGFDSIDRELHLLDIENSQIELEGFRKIAAQIATIDTLQRFFKKNREFYVELHDQAEDVVLCVHLKTAIDGVIDRHGLIKDDASEQLFEVRKRLKHVRGQISSSFNRALTVAIKSDHLDEIRESVVEGKRVLAVKAMHRRKVKGVVVGSSKTGSIVYMEPRATLEYENELSNLLYEEAEAIKKILKELTDLHRPSLEDLRDGQSYLTQIDVLYAKAKYASAINACKPRIAGVKQLILKDAYHPLLLMSNAKRKEKTIPQTLSLTNDSRIIVISGPNAGGKSITLKTVGLLQLMLQSGILVPVDPTSSFGWFDRVLSDIGDNQSIDNHLSTYSYRLKQMNYFLKKCNGKTLFLIDEFGTGSDPELGGALAETFLEEFYEREAFGIITTHYTNLKLLASELPHALNANMQFDPKSLEPLYTLFTGEAGSSYTFEVAQKNGIPYGLINRAKKKIAAGKVRFDKTIANLQKERSEIRKTTASLKSEAEKAKEETRQLEETQQKVQQKLERYQELFDSQQRMIQLGKKIDAIAASFANHKRKRQLIDEVMKLVAVENAKRKPAKKPKAPAKKKEEKAKKHQLKEEVEKEMAVIRKRKKKEKAQQTKQEAAKPKVLPKIGDRVRMIDGKAIGTLDSIEKDTAVVNYGIFTTKVSVTQLEKV